MMTMCLHEHREIRYLNSDRISSGVDESGHNLSEVAETMYAAGDFSEPKCMLFDRFERLMRLDYYLYESECEWEFRAIGSKNVTHFNISSYGVAITKTESDAFEEKLIPNMTNDHHRAREILQLLADNCVTPFCLQEILEDLFANE